MLVEFCAHLRDGYVTRKEILMKKIGRVLVLLVLAVAVGATPNAAVADLCCDCPECWCTYVYCGYPHGCGNCSADAITMFC